MEREREVWREEEKEKMCGRIKKGRVGECESRQVCACVQTEKNGNDVFGWGMEWVGSGSWLTHKS